MTRSVESGNAQGRRGGWRPGCEPGLFEELKCRAEGRRKRAEYDAEHAEELDSARASFEAARAAYTRGRTAAEPLVEQAWKDYHGLVEKVSCKLSEEDTHRVEVAYERVARRLSECDGTDGSCADADHDYDDVGQCPPEEITARIEEIERRTAEATACFHSLIEETQDPVAPPTGTTSGTLATGVPAARSGQSTGVAAGAASAPGSATPEQTPTTKGLLARVAGIQAELQRIANRVKGEGWEAARVYAELLVARGHLQSVWHGFANFNDYVDCVCQALTSMVEGHAAIGLLKGRVAVDDCHRRTWEADCAHLREHAADEVVAEFLRVCEDEWDTGAEQENTSQEPPDRIDQDDGRPSRSRPEEDRTERSAPPEPAPGRGTAAMRGGGRGTQQPRYRDELGRYRAP